MLSLQMKASSSRGFTLVEVLLVIVIIGVLSGMVVTQLSGRSQEAKITQSQCRHEGEPFAGPGPL